MKKYKTRLVPVGNCFTLVLLWSSSGRVSSFTESDGPEIWSWSMCGSSCTTLSPCQHLSTMSTSIASSYRWQGPRPQRTKTCYHIHHSTFRPHAQHGSLHPTHCVSNHANGQCRTQKHLKLCHSRSDEASASPALPQSSTLPSHSSSPIAMHHCLAPDLYFRNERQHA